MRIEFPMSLMQNPLLNHLSLSSLPQARKEIDEKIEEVAMGRGKRRKKLVKRERMRILR